MLPAPSARARAQWVLAAALLVVAFILRGRFFGDLVSHADEQFYLLVGDRMLHDHALPYVDIWDRKPVGLFLLFAAIRALGGNGVVEYQLVATLFAAGTAFLIGRWVLVRSGLVAALAAAIFYLFLIQKYLGFGGQAEVFVNLFSVAAGAIVHALLMRFHRDNRLTGDALFWGGAAAMLLSGIAVQIKTTAVFPGIALGLALLWLGWRRSGGLSRQAGAAAFWALVALAPSLLAAGYYYVHGHLDAFLFANFWSNALKGADHPTDIAQRNIDIAVALGLPFGAAVAVHLLRRWRGLVDPAERVSVNFLLAWLASGVAAFLAVGLAYPHYAMLMMPMGCILVGYLARPRGIGWLFLAGVAAMSARIAWQDQQRYLANRQMSPNIAALAETIKPRLGDGCLYVYHGPPILYLLTESCLPTPFVFPTHLNSQPEAPALGIDPEAEVARILRSRPPVIVDQRARAFHPPNLRTKRLIAEALRTDYEVLGVTGGRARIIAYVRKDLADKRR